MPTIREQWWKSDGVELAFSISSFSPCLKETFSSHFFFPPLHRAAAACSDSDSRCPTVEAWWTADRRVQCRLSSPLCFILPPSVTEIHTRLCCFSLFVLIRSNMNWRRQWIYFSQTVWSVSFQVLKVDVLVDDWFAVLCRQGASWELR